MQGGSAFPYGRFRSAVAASAGPGVGDKSFSFG